MLGNVSCQWSVVRCSSLLKRSSRSIIRLRRIRSNRRAGFRTRLMILLNPPLKKGDFQNQFRTKYSLQYSPPFIKGASGFSVGKNFSRVPFKGDLKAIAEVDRNHGLSFTVGALKSPFEKGGGFFDLAAAVTGPTVLLLHRCLVRTTARCLLSSTISPCALSLFRRVSTSFHMPYALCSMPKSTILA